MVLLFSSQLDLTMEEIELKASFQEQLYKSYEINKRVLITQEENEKTIGDLIEANKTMKKTPHQYYLLKKYELLECGDVKKLIRCRLPGESPLYFVSIEETYDVIKRAHIATGHGGRDKMLKETNKKYANITVEALNIFKSSCEQCQKKRKRVTTKGVVVKPILTKDFRSRAQIDLIDMQSMSHNNYKWIMNYQDHLTKFVVLRTLTSKRASEVASELLDIFLMFGAPSVLQSDNGTEFTAQIINELKELWPELVIVHGKPRHPQSQGSIERSNCDVKDMLTAWLADNNSTDWTIGLKFVQFQKNSSHHSGIQRTPFAALLGSDAKVGLTTSSLPQEVLAKLQTEDDLLQVLAPETQPRTARDNSSEIPSGSSEQSETDNDDLASQQENIQVHRKRAAESQIKQAERMVKRSKIVLSTVKVGDNVTIPIPAVDRGRTDPRNLIGVVTDISDNEMYSIAVKAGQLNAKYSRNQFDVCATPLYSVSDMSCDNVISLRTAVQQESNCGGQGFTKCNCSGSKRCQINRCKAKLMCNSRCHSSLDCKNKN